MDEKTENSTRGLVGDVYKIGNKFAAGNFGEVRICKNVVTKTIYAAKVETVNPDSHQLENEFRIYNKLKNQDGFCKIHFYGTYQNYNVLIMDYLGKNLEALYTQNKRKFSTKTIIMIALQAIKRLQTLHEAGYIYRDIKPENFVVGKSEEKKKLIYLVDFGLSKSYLDEVTGKHIPYRENKNLTGTARYMSVNTHIGREQSRRDDLEALGYMLIYFFKNTLPWQGLKVNSVKERYYKIGELKRITSIEILCKGLPDPWLNYMKYVKTLSFYENPNYDYIKKLFLDYAHKVGYIIDNIFDWVNLEVYSKSSMISVTTPSSIPPEKHKSKLFSEINFIEDNALLNPMNSQNKCTEMGHIRRPTPSTVVTSSNNKKTNYCLPNGERIQRNKFKESLYKLKLKLLDCCCSSKFTNVSVSSE